jgi:RHS repeat-associated protein
MSYNGDNRRVISQQGATSTKFVWDATTDAYLSELDAANAVQAVYTNEPQHYGSVVSQRRSSTSHWLHADALGTTRLLTSSTQTITDTYLLDAWGNPIASSGTTVNPFRWVGRYGYYQDSSTGMVYVRARMYQPLVARWSSVDPEDIRIMLDSHVLPNSYMYGLNNVTTVFDPSGLWVFRAGMGSLSGTLGPGDTASYGDAHSEWLSVFKPKKDAFAHICPTCVQVRFVQIFFMSVNALNTSLPNRRWTIDPYKGTPPYFPDGFWSNPSEFGGSSSMHDDPNFKTLWKYGTLISMDFETCAVCSESGGGPGTCVGEVYACVIWGHSFVLKGGLFNTRVIGWKRYVESDIWSSDDPIVVGRKNDPQHSFDGIASEPTKNMTPFLDKYFPTPQ